MKTLITAIFLIASLPSYASVSVDSREAQALTISANSIQECDSKRAEILSKFSKANVLILRTSQCAYSRSDFDNGSFVSSIVIFKY